MVASRAVRRCGAEIHNTRQPCRQHTRFSSRDAPLRYKVRDRIRCRVAQGEQTQPFPFVPEHTHRPEGETKATIEEDSENLHQIIHDLSVRTSCIFLSSYACFRWVQAVPWLLCQAGCCTAGCTVPADSEPIVHARRIRFAHWRGRCVCLRTLSCTTVVAHTSIAVAPHWIPRDPEILCVSGSH